MAYHVVDTQGYGGVSNISSDIMRLRRYGQCHCLDLSGMKHTEM